MSGRLIAVTMRVDSVADRGERRDALDQRLSRLIVEMGATPAPIVNDLSAARSCLTGLRPTAVVLSGGNDLAVLGGDAPERDDVEREILRWADAADIPVIGICRGMQLIAVEAGATLRRSNGHVCAAHALHGVLAGEVPSHHAWCVDEAPRGFSVLAEADDGTCEAFLRHDGRRLGMMWHPERIWPTRREDVTMIKTVLGL